jgi:Domain of unknown function (DUF4160)
MPTVLRVGPYRFFFYAGDGDEPPHVHEEQDDDEAKFWLSPPRLQRNVGSSRKQLNKIEGIIEDHQDVLTRSWDEFVSK